MYRRILLNLVLMWHIVVVHLRLAPGEHLLLVRLLGSHLDWTSLAGLLAPTQLFEVDILQLLHRSLVLLLLVLMTILLRSHLGWTVLVLLLLLLLNGLLSVQDGWHYTTLEA